MADVKSPPFSRYSNVSWAKTNEIETKVSSIITKIKLDIQGFMINGVLMIILKFQ